MFNEEQLEDATLNILESLGYDRINGYEIDRDYHSVLWMIIYLMILAKLILIF